MSREFLSVCDAECDSPTDDASYRLMNCKCADIPDGTELNFLRLAIIWDAKEHEADASIVVKRTALAGGVSLAVQYAVLPTIQTKLSSVRMQ
jgi:hypothetical protein